jgi:hypothetical protein
VGYKCPPTLAFIVGGSRVWTDLEAERHIVKEYLAWVFFVMGAISLGVAIMNLGMQVWVTRSPLTLSMMLDVPQASGLAINALFFRLWWRLM